MSRKSCVGRRKVKMRAAGASSSSKKFETPNPDRAAEDAGIRTSPLVITTPILNESHREIVRR